MASSAVNFTIDDASGDEPMFHFAPTWSIGALSLDEEPYPLSEALPTDTDTPDPPRLFNGTHTAVYLPSGNTNSSYTLSLGFNGTTIYVYFVLSRRARTECEFHLDDEHLTPTTYSRKTPELFEYNQLAYSISNLSLRMHNLRITTRQIQPYDIYLNFDYAIYSRPSDLLQHLWPRDPTTTIEDGYPSKPTQTSTKQHLTAKLIAGGVIGGIITVACVIFGFYLYRRRRLQHRQHRAKYRANPFTDTRSPRRLSPPNEEHRRLMPFGLPISPHSNHASSHLSPSHPDTWVPGNPMPEPNINPNLLDRNRRGQPREERQRELNNQLQTVTREMRSLKEAYMLDQRKARMQAGKGQHTTETDATIHASVLADMREQMTVMMDQIHHLQAQQSPAYNEGRLDDPPPDYLQVIDGRNRP